MHGLHDSKCAHLDDLQGLDVENIISTGRRTRGIRVDYTKVPDMKGIDDESGSETEAKGPKEREEAIANPRTRSPERTPVTNVEEKGEEEEEGGEDGQDEDSSDEDGDEDDDDEEA